MRFLRMAACCNYTKTIIHLRLSEYRVIKTSTSSRFLFANIRFAFGELLLNISNQSIHLQQIFTTAKDESIDSKYTHLSCVKFTLNMHTSLGKKNRLRIFVRVYNSEHKCGI